MQYSNPQTFSELEARVTKNFPNGTMEEDLQGQILIYTGLVENKDGDIIPVVEDEKSES